MLPTSQRQYMMTIDALRAENEALRKDVERYRVLCTCGFPTQHAKFGPMWWKDGGLHYTLDAACDAKIAAMGEQHGKD